jgi:hypothetical protein
MGVEGTPCGLEASSEVMKVLYRLAFYLIRLVLILPEAPLASLLVPVSSRSLLSRITS